MHSSSSAEKPKLLTLAWPIFVEQALRMLIAIVDTFMVSHISDDAVAGVSVSSQIVISRQGGIHGFQPGNFIKDRGFFCFFAFRHLDVNRLPQGKGHNHTRLKPGNEGSCLKLCAQLSAR